MNPTQMSPPNSVPSVEAQSHEPQSASGQAPPRTSSESNPAQPPLRVSKGRRQDQAILAMLQFPTLEKAAQAVGVHPSTLRRWWKNPEFRRKYDEARETVYVQAQGRMQQGCPAAVATIFQLMRDPQTPANTRLQAAKYVLDPGKRLERADRSAPLQAYQEVKLAERILAARKRMRSTTGGTNPLNHSHH